MAGPGIGKTSIEGKEEKHFLQKTGPVDSGDEPPEKLVEKNPIPPEDVLPKGGSACALKNRQSLGSALIPTDDLFARR